LLPAFALRKLLIDFKFRRRLYANRPKHPKRDEEIESLNRCLNRSKKNISEAQALI
jgi:hypothetical protein